MHSVVVTVAGLTSTGLVLQLNGVAGTVSSANFQNGNTA
jgi:hypothetical protein